MNNTEKTILAVPSLPPPTLPQAGVDRKWRAPLPPQNQMFGNGGGRGGRFSEKW